LVELVVTELITNGVKASGVKLDLGWNDLQQPADPLATSNLLAPSR